MARYKNGINGPVKGKIGNVVAATCRGVDYLRSLAEPSGKAPTPAQLNQRLRFALVMGWLKPLLDLINIGFQVSGGDQTPMNRAVSLHLKEAVCGTGPDYEIDFPKAVLSRGVLLPSFIEEVKVLPNALLQVKWCNFAASALNKETDLVTFIVYSSAQRKFATFKNAALREEKEVLLQLPKGFEEGVLHAYMQHVNEAGDAVSTSVYFQHVFR